MAPRMQDDSYRVSVHGPRSSSLDTAEAEAPRWHSQAAVSWRPRSGLQVARSIWTASPRQPGSIRDLDGPGRPRPRPRGSGFSLPDEVRDPLPGDPAQLLACSTSMLPGRTVPLGQLTSAQADTRQPEPIYVADHRVHRKQVLGGLTHEYYVAA